jgi:DNA-binding transcriptional ArsR family regulator
LRTAQSRPGQAPATDAAESGALDEIFAALSDPIRRGIVARLTEGPCSVTELGAPFAVSAPAISKHLAVLERCELIERAKIGRVRYCHLRAEPLAQAAGWIEQHRAFWQQQLDSLAQYLDGETEPCEPPAATRPS